MTNPSAGVVGSVDGARFGRLCRRSRAANRRGRRYQEKEHCGEIVDHHRERGLAAGHSPARLQIASVSHLYVREDGDQARREFEPYYRQALVEGAKRTGMEMPPFDYEEKLRGPLLCHDRYRHEMHMFHSDFGGLPWKEVARTMELFASEVAPVLQAKIARGRRRV